MGKLNIAHHKSYHPYRRDNIEKVRRDEEEAREKEAKEEGRMMLADSEARMDRLRERAGVDEKKKKKKNEEEFTTGGQAQPAALPTSGGHINFFEDLEMSTISAAIKTMKKADTKEDDKGVPLAPSAKDLKPWYVEKSSERKDDAEDEKRKRDSIRKSMHDPLTSINRQLASRPSDSSASPYSNTRHHFPPRISFSTSISSEVQSRLTRESSERQRALELIKRKKRELEGGETPSSVHGGGYGDVYNRREVEEAHRVRDRRWDDRHRHRRW